MLDMYLFRRIFYTYILPMIHHSIYHGKNNVFTSHELVMYLLAFLEEHHGARAIG